MLVQRVINLCYTGNMTRLKRLPVMTPLNTASKRRVRRTGCLSICRVQVPVASANRGLKESPMMTRYAMQDPQRYKIRITDRPAKPHACQLYRANAKTASFGASLVKPCLTVQTFTGCNRVMWH